MSLIETQTLTDDILKGLASKSEAPEYQTSGSILNPLNHTAFYK